MATKKQGGYNNPGGIKTRSGVVRYPSWESGYEALNSLLYRMYDHMTLKEMFQIYAPSSDGNKPSKYAETVRQYLNEHGYQVEYGTVLDFSDPAFRGVFTCAIAMQETGRIPEGEAFALEQAKRYDPTKDSRQTYSRTEKRRENRKDRPKQTLRAQQKDDGVSVRVAPEYDKNAQQNETDALQRDKNAQQNDKNTPHLELNTRLSSAGKRVSNSSQTKPQSQSKER